MIAYGDPYSLPDDLSMWKWAEANIELSPRMPALRKGPYSTSLTPYIRGIFDALNDPNVNRVTVKKGAQTGLTLAAYIAMCYWVCEDPDPILLVMPSRDLARSKSETTLQPLMEDSPRVARELKSSKDDFKKLQYNMRRCSVHLVGANSASNLASREVRYLVLDELDKYPGNVGREADAVSLAIDRTWSFSPFEKIFEFSSPVNEKGPASYIHNAHKIGDMREYKIPCPHCEKRFTLKFEHYKWDAEMYEATKALTDRSEVLEASVDAYIQCPHCAGVINEHQRMKAVELASQYPDRGWVSTNPSYKPGHVSFHLSGLISPFLPIEKVVSEFLIAKAQAAGGFLGPLQNVVNSIFGEAWTAPPKKSTSKGRIWELSKLTPFDQFTIPTDEPCIIFATVDVQSSHLVYCIWATTLKNLWLVDHGFLSTMDELESLRELTLFDVDENERNVQRVFIDTGYDTMKCYRACLEHSWLIPIKGEKGQKTRQTKPIAPSKIDSFPGGKLFGGRRSLTLYHIHPSFFKDELSQSIEGDSEVSIAFHSSIDKDFVKQMTGEVVRETDPDKYGNTMEYWEKVHTNDYWDCSQYAYAVRHLAQKDLLRLHKRHLRQVAAIEETSTATGE